MSDKLTLSDEELAELGFEAAQTRLEQVVAELEAGQIPLERALALYELGLQLRDLCRQRLAAAEGALTRLRESVDGTLSEEDTEL